MPTVIEPRDRREFQNWLPVKIPCPTLLLLPSLLPCLLRSRQGFFLRRPVCPPVCVRARTGRGRLRNRILPLSRLILTDCRAQFLHAYFQNPSDLRHRVIPGQVLGGFDQVFCYSLHDSTYLCITTATVLKASAAASQMEIRGMNQASAIQPNPTHTLQHHIHERILGKNPSGMITPCLFLSCPIPATARRRTKTSQGPASCTRIDEIRQVASP